FFFFFWGGGYRYTCNSCKVNIATIKYTGDDLPKKNSRFLHLTYLYLHKLINWQITSLISVKRADLYIVKVSHRRKS
ncbi:hypothetical protein AAJ76_1830004920, partial [Vairimorpha ceranae]